MLESATSAGPACDLFLQVVVLLLLLRNSTGHSTILPFVLLDVNHLGGMSVGRNCVYQLMARASGSFSSIHNARLARVSLASRLPAAASIDLALSLCPIMAGLTYPYIVGHQLHPEVNLDADALYALQAKTLPV